MVINGIKLCYIFLNDYKFSVKKVNLKDCTTVHSIDNMAIMRYIAYSL